MDVRDQLACASATTAQVAAFTALDKLQDFRPAEQVAGAALLFAMLVRRFNVDARDVLAQTDRRIADALNDPRLRAIQQYLATEISG
jgi:hypothetical protein